jgi:hypothetical protein
VGQLIVPSTPIHYKYSEFMRGVDVTDQLHASYSVQLRSYKWWHKILNYVVDQSLVNNYIIDRDRRQELGMPLVSPMKFNLRIANYLVCAHIRRKQSVVHPPRHPKQPYEPEKNSRRQPCIVCGAKKKGYCVGCGYIWMCPIGCWGKYHCPENWGRIWK